jgi:hypothetical protein
MPCPRPASVKNQSARGAQASGPEWARNARTPTISPIWPADTTAAAARLGRANRRLWAGMSTTPAAAAATMASASARLVAIGFFHQYVLAGLGRTHCHLRVRRVRRADVDRVYVRAAQHLVPVGDNRAAAPLGSGGLRRGG